MNLFLRFLFLLSLSLIYVSPFYAMLVFGQVGVSPDKSKYVAYLGHYHGRTTAIETRQLEDLVSICKEGTWEGKKFHILYERSGDIIKVFTPLKGVLCHLEDVFAEAQVPNCTFENIEIRDASAAASHILDAQGKVFDPKLTWNNEGSKEFDQLAFQDVFDEFERHASEIKPFVDEVVQENADRPNVFLITEKYNAAYDSLNCVKKLLALRALTSQDKILNIARERPDDCQRLDTELHRAFSDLFDLHIFRRLTQLDPDVQPIVITGGMHSIGVAQLFGELQWEDQLIKGTLFQEVYNPLGYRALRSIILNETEWTGFAKDTYKYWASIKLSLGARFQSLRAYLL